MTSKKVKIQMIKSDMNATELAKAARMTRATLYARLKDGNFTVSEAKDICDALGVTDLAERALIFLT